MKQKKAVRWLYDQLPELVSQGVLSPQNAEDLQRHYGDASGASGRRIALILCSTVGATLIGIGIILLLAHNWTGLSRDVRAVLSFVPLVAAQLLVGYTVACRRESVAWRESTATFLALCIGSSIALIGQTYHIPGDMGSFLLTWMLLGLPLVYLVGASLPALLYLVGATAWAGYVQDVGGHAALFWPLAALVVPHVVQVGRRDPYGTRSVFLSWGVAICLCIATGICLEKILPGLWIIVYTGLFAVMYLVGSFWFGDAPTMWRRPLHTVGAGGIFWVSFILTYEEFWRRIGWSHYRYGARYHEWAAVVDYVLAGTLLVGAACLLVTCVRRRQTDKLVFGSAPAVAILGYTFAAFGADEAFSMILFNLYLLVLATVTIAVGLRERRMSTVNVGMLMLTLLIVARFFDEDMSFVARGIAFILCGAGFLTTNLVLLRKRGVEK